jgi:hypothetical protein
MPDNFKFDNVGPRGGASGMISIERDGFDWDHIVSTVPATEHSVMLRPSVMVPHSSFRPFEREMMIRAFVDTSLERASIAIQAPYDPNLLTGQTAPTFDFGVADLFKIHHVESFDVHDGSKLTMNKKQYVKPTHSLKSKKKKQRRNKK